MTPEESTDKLEADLKEQEVEMGKLRSNLAENKEASKELKKSLENLESVTKKGKRLSQPATLIVFVVVLRGTVVEPSVVERKTMQDRRN